jgi:hypothetical protein
MAEQIVHKSLSKESKKTESNLDFEICSNEYRQQSSEFIEPTNPTDENPPLIREATVCYLPAPADHFVSILEETISNLTHLHEDLSKLQEILVKGGVL